tara:strand:- start:6476 stop:7663 length:1188 start_codon:yes stop_codon:yes gene_type:complete
MAAPIETNEEYYAGEKVFGVVNPATQDKFVSTFNIELTTEGVGNFVVQLSTDNGVTWSDITAQVDGVANDNTVSPPYFTNTVSLNPAIAPGVGETYLVKVKLKEEAFRNNYGSYSYITLDDIINNFLAAYVGAGKLIPSVKRTDVIFHAKRGLQEFSYDTLNSIKKLEVDMPPSLSIPIPQDYINYVRVRYVDNLGVLHPIYPLNGLSTNPTDLPLQNQDGSYIQGSYGENLQAQQSLTEEKWKEADDKRISGAYDDEWSNYGVYTWTWRKNALGQRYGLNPQTSQSNGWFSINQRTNTFSFSSNLASELIILEYISDGLYTDTDTKVPKMIEEAMYMHIAYSILAGRFGIPEYIVQRFKKDKYAQLRNAKIRLSNMKPSEIVQVFRNKSKWIKH